MGPGTRPLDTYLSTKSIDTSAASPRSTPSDVQLRVMKKQRMPLLLRKAVVAASKKGAKIVVEIKGTGMKPVYQEAIKSKVYKKTAKFDMDGKPKLAMSVADKAPMTVTTSVGRDGDGRLTITTESVNVKTPRCMSRTTRSLREGGGVLLVENFDSFADGSQFTVVRTFLRV